MKNIKYILGNPFIILLVSLIVLSFTPNQHAFYAFALVFSLFFISLIYMVIQKKWLKLILSFIGYFVFLICFVLVVFFTQSLEPRIGIGNQEFYKNEISNTLNLGIPSQLKLVAKTDTIIFVGIEGEYDVECLYQGSKKIITQLERKIKAHKLCTKADRLDINQTDVLTSRNFNLEELGSVYAIHDEGRYIIHVAFNKSRTKFYYEASHY